MLEDYNKPFWKFTEYILHIFFFLFPLINFQGFLYGPSSIRALNLMILVCVLLFIFAIRSLKKDNSITIQKSPIYIVLLVYFVMVVVSGIFGLSFETSFWSVATRTTGIIYYILLGFFIFFLSNTLSDRKKQDNLILTIIISTSVYSVLSLMGPEGLNWFFKDYQSDAFTFGNSTFAAMYIFGAFLLSIYYLLQSNVRKKWMYLLPVILVINPYILSYKIWALDFSSGLVGEARASSYVIVMSIFSLGAFWAISKIKNINLKKKISYTLFLVSVLLMFFSIFSLLSPNGLVRNLYLDQATGVRPLTWEMSGNIISERPYFGWGTDNFERLFENNYDNRVLQGEYGNEAWLDRSHNVIVDTAVENGIIGLVFYLLIYLVIILCLIYASLNGKDKRDRILSTILISYFTLHLLELQTAFDTTISYPIVAFMIALSIVLFGRAIRDVKDLNTEISINNKYAKYIISTILFISVVWIFIYAYIPFYSVQNANVRIREIGSAEQRLDIYPDLFSSPIDRHAFLWRISVDFQRGVAESPETLNDPNSVVFLKKELQVIEDEYKDYLRENPNHFRAYLNLADILIYQKLFDVDKLAEAQEALDKAISLVPQSPQTYWMKAVAYVYMAKFELAREYAQEGIDLNPKIKQSHDVLNYVEKSIKNFPEVDLFFFRQI